MHKERLPQRPWATKTVVYTLQDDVDPSHINTAAYFRLGKVASTDDQLKRPPSITFRRPFSMAVHFTLRVLPKSSLNRLSRCLLSYTTALFVLSLQIRPLAGSHATLFMAVVLLSWLSVGKPCCCFHRVRIYLDSRVLRSQLLRGLGFLYCGLQSRNP